MKGLEMQLWTFAAVKYYVAKSQPMKAENNNTVSCNFEKRARQDSNLDNNTDLTFSRAVCSILHSVLT